MDAPTCSLAPEELTKRITWIRSEILPHLRREEELPSGVVWELEDSPGLAETLERWAALERRCCGHLTFERGPGARPGQVRLEIRRSQR